jgi:hypothetical protein
LGEGGRGDQRGGDEGEREGAHGGLSDVRSLGKFGRWRRASPVGLVALSVSAWTI